ncbi:MAG: hypothetical protein IJK63_09710 [Oscillospiraceae bacterium]|nr:hypothetical protein [Oscillospiraceae bacterium]
MARYQIDNLPAPIDFQATDKTLRRLQNAKNLLMCRMGEVPFDRFRGFDTTLLELPLPELRTELLPELDRLMIWEPGAEVVSAEATLLTGGELYIKVILEISE